MTCSFKAHMKLKKYHEHLDYSSNLQITQLKHMHQTGKRNPELEKCMYELSKSEDYGDFFRKVICEELFCYFDELSKTNAQSYYLSLA